MFEKAIAKIIENGILGVLLVLAILAIVKLFHIIMKMHTDGMADKIAYLDALNRNTKAAETVNSTLQVLVETVRTSTHDKSQKLIEALALRGISAKD